MTFIHLKPRKILIFRTDRLGDLILSLPVVEALKAALPEAEIDLLTAPFTAPLARMQRHVSDVIPDTFQGFQGFRDLIRLLKAQPYGAAIHLYPRPTFALASFLARIPVRLGTAYRYYSPLFHPRVPLHRKDMVAHELDLNLKLVEALGIPRPDKVTAGLSVPEAADHEVRQLLAREGIGGSRGRFVVLHPGSGGSSLDWPGEHYAVLGARVVALGFPVVLTGADWDCRTVDRVHAWTGRQAVNLCGRLDLGQLAALLARASLVVSNSTGPLHLAEALGTRVIGLYSPFFYSSPRRWGPYSQPENVLVPEGRTCRRCPGERCPDFNCLAAIRPEAVLATATGLLDRDRAERV